MSLLTGVLSKGKSRGNPSLGEGYKPSFAGVFALLRPGRPHSGDLGNRPLRRLLRRLGWTVWRLEGRWRVKPAGWLAVVRKAPSTLALCRSSPWSWPAQGRWWGIITLGVVVRPKPAASRRSVVVGGCQWRSMVAGVVGINAANASLPLRFERCFFAWLAYFVV